MSSTIISLHNTAVHLIKDAEFSYLANKMIAFHVPQYFYEIPAFSGKRDRQEVYMAPGGLVEHTRAAMTVASELMQTSMYTFGEETQKCILLALLLHDTFKRGLYDTGRSDPKHPLIAARAFYSASEVYGFPIGAINTLSVYYMILTHMGRHNRGSDGRRLFPRPFTKAQKFVSLCDFIAANDKIKVTTG